MTTASRIVLDPGVRDVVDRIQEVTRSNSPSAAIALMVSRYGRHLLETWELSAARYPEPQPEPFLQTAAPPAPVVPAAPVFTNFRFDEPIEL